VPVARHLVRPTRRFTDEQPASTPAVQVYYPFCLVLLRMGFTQPDGLPPAGELLPHHFALTRNSLSVCRYSGRYVSVALSLRLLSLAVSQHPALWSSDFPRTLQPAIACLPQIHLCECNISLSTRLASLPSSRDGANRRRRQRGNGCWHGRAPQDTPTPSWGRGSSCAHLHGRAHPSCATGHGPAGA